MVRGKKPINGEAMKELYAVRITKKQKEVLVKNPWIKKELDEIVRKHLSIFIVKEE